MLHTHIVLQKRIHVSALISSSFLLVLSSLALFPVASSYSDTLAAPAPSETTLSMTSENINLDFSVGVNGAFNVSDPADLSVVTNNFSGYTLSILASSTDETATKLLNGEYAFNSISTTSSADDFNVGNWGIRPSKVNSTDNTDFIPAPTTEGTVLDATSVANANANTYTIALGAKADYSLPAGRYSNSFVVTAVANPVGYAINYDANTEDAVTDMPDDETGEIPENDVTISELIPTRTGYTFGGWCNGNVVSADGIDSCDDTVYNPGDAFLTDLRAQNVLDLIAMWNRTFVLNFDANGGTGTMSPQTITGVGANINGNTFTRTGYDFSGWNTASNGTGVAYASGAAYAIPATGANQTLYAQWTAKNYTITLNANGGSGGSTSTTVTYGNTTLGAITNPTKASVNGTRTVSGFTKPSGNNASGTTVSSTDTLNSTNTTSYSFNGWYKESSATNKIASNATTPVLEASTSYTNSSRQWTSASGQTLYAGWTTNTGSYSQVTLPTITRTGYTCGWTETSTGATSITYASGAKMTPTKNTVLYGVCVANTYTIVYAGNNNTGGSMANTTCTYNQDCTLRNNAFTRTNYIFGGWKNGSTGYSNGQVVKNLATSGTVTLTAQWGATFDQACSSAGKSKVTVSGTQYYRLQDMSTSICNTVAMDQTTRLVDTRDNKIYYVGKLRDSKCWLLDNLALDITNSSVKNNLTSSTTNANNTALNYLKNGGGSAPYSSTAVTTFSSTSSANPQVELTKIDTTNTSDSLSGASSWKYGVLYNWCAVTGGTRCGGSSASATEDICPLNWRLPTYDTDNEYRTLLNSYTTRTSWSQSEKDAFRTAFRLPLGPGYRYTQFYSAGSSYFFTSTYTSQLNRPYVLYTGSSNYEVGTSSGSTLYGFSVRCVAK